MGKIKILIADDHKMVREGLKDLLEKHADLTVVGEAADGLMAIEQAKKFAPDIIIMDISMPGLNGIEATRQILATNDKIKVIALSMHSDRRFVFESLKAGAKGFILKECAFEELVSAIKLTLEDKIYLSSKITDVLVKDYVSSKAGDSSSAFSMLTSREREVLQMLSEGCNTKDIALKLNVSAKTIETYRLQLMNKLDIHSIAELTKYAIKEGLTTV